MILLLGPLLALAQEPQPAESVAELVDAYVDARFEADPGATERLIANLAERGVEGAAAVEQALRAPRSSYADAAEWVGATTEHEIECYHVDYESRFHLYVGEGHDPSVPAPLVVVGHGGNSSMSAEYADQTARQYLDLYGPPLAEHLGAIVVAPVSERGWGPIGYSLVFSTISAVSRLVPVDADRIYLTGQSMGGHLSYRMALLFPDVFGAVSPHSGGYDFVEKGTIGNLINVPGLSIFGRREPYGIREDNLTNETFAKRYHLDWEFAEQDGGHEIYGEELPGMAKFFAARPRDLYPSEVFLRRGGPLRFEKTWEIEGWPDHEVRFESRPLFWNTCHWIEVDPRPEAGEPLEVHAELDRKRNEISITSNQVRTLRVLLHPRLIDLEEPLTIDWNGQEVFEGNVEADVAQMLERARATDDRGRVFWASLPLETERDRKVSLPKRRSR